MPSISERKIDALLNGEVLFVMIDMMQFINKGSDGTMELFGWYNFSLLSFAPSFFRSMPIFFPQVLQNSLKGTRNNDVK